nr:amino acid ABC transporter substrate-binding protein [Desulfobacula sp.]
MSVRPWAQRPGDLKNRTVGVVRGTGSVSVLQKAGANLDIANNKDLLMEKLVHGRYDIAVVADLTGLYSLQSLNRLGDYGYEPLYRSPLDLMFSKKHPDSAGLKEKFNSGLNKIKEDGTFMKILRKYYPNGQVNKEALPQDMR